MFGHMFGHVWLCLGMFGPWLCSYTREQAGDSVAEADHARGLAERRAERAASRVEELSTRSVHHPRTTQEWAALAPDAYQKAQQRERTVLKSIMSSHTWRLTDLSAVLAELGWVEKLSAAHVEILWTTHVHVCWVKHR